MKFFFIEKNLSVGECVNVGLNGKRFVKEYMFLSVKIMVSLKICSVIRDWGRLGFVGVWIEKENRF